MITLASTALPPRAELVAAMLASDPAYEGLFFTAVRTTGIFCRPTCSARKPNPENVEFYATADEALAAGFRPCKRCRPLQTPDETPAWVTALLTESEAQPTRRWSDADLRARGVDPVQLRRWCREHFGMTFHSWTRARRLGSALGSLRDGETIDAAALEQGYESTSAFRDALRKTFDDTPARLRARVPLVFRRLTTPLGPMIAMAEARGLVLLEFVDRPALTAELNELRDRHGYAIAPGTHEHLDAVDTQMSEYFAGKRRRFDLPLHTPGSSFEQSVWTLLREIPFGTTCTYGALAEQLGRPGAARAVGTANGRNRLAILLPCHRVVGADGSLTGYGGGKPRKAFLLRLERDVLSLSHRP